MDAKKRIISASIGMVIGTTIYCFGVVFILRLGSFYASGVTGIAQLLSEIIDKIFNSNFSYFMSVFIGLFNIPLFLIGWNGVSKKFAVLSLASVGLQVVLNTIFQYIYNKYGSPFDSLADNRLLLAILGGLVNGVGMGIALRCGSSTGGMDIVSQYLSFKKKTPFTKISFTINFVIIFVGGVVNGIETAAYTIVNLIICILVLDKIHTIYKFMKISIITEEKGRMREELVKKFNHGVTIYPVIGGYSNAPKYVLESIVSSYEINDYRDIAKMVDPHCFISYTNIKGIDGNFNQNTIT